MSNVKSFTVGYNPINQHNVFSSGDYISGQISLELDKDCQINSLWVKMKGKAEVKWTEHYGKMSVTYCGKEKYFSLKTFIIEESQGNYQVAQGSHVYPFTFQIPAQNLPPSFKSSCGKIKYTLEANLSRSMRMDSKAKTKFTLIPKGGGNIDPWLMSPQHSTVDKKMKLFTSGAVGMDVNIDRTGFMQGEGIKVVASIQNKSSRDIKPKYCLYQKHSFYAKGKRRVETKDILKEVGDPIPPSAGQTVIRTITIPPSMCVSILNSNIIKAEYRLRVYLDVKYASDPQIKFPIAILPAVQGSGEEPTGPAYEFGGFKNFPQEPTTFGPSAPLLPNGTYGMYPSLANLSGKS
ncbi:arrestin domain-containing protein 3-like [Aulostomus maculatus]